MGSCRTAFWMELFSESSIRICYGSDNLNGYLILNIQSNEFWNGGEFGPEGSILA